MDTRNDPIEFAHEDQLGRSSTAKVFSKALLGNPSRPMIVAVFGPWGSGKTSFANLLSSELRTSGASCAWFNPWQFTNVEAMTVAFFDLLATSLAAASQADYQAVREVFFRYAESVTSMALVNGQSKTPAKRPLRLAAEPVRATSRLSVSDQRLMMTKLFAASQKPIVVFIDDIDRLFATEIRLLIQLVKSNADFPNLKFALLFQKETVEAALKTDGQTGADFLEKIIEVPIELPLIRGGRYVSDLLSEIAEIFGDLGELTPADNERWQYLLRQGILKPFTTLRQKNRLVDRLQLHKWNVDSSQGIDINVVDLLALEVLRSIDYDLYNVIRMRGPALTEAGDHYASAAADERSTLDELLAEASSQNHEVGVLIVQEMFPCLGASRFPSSPAEDERTGRICRSRHFPKFFFEGLLPEELSRSGRRRIESAVMGGDSIYDLFTAFQDRQMIFEGLDFLRSLAMRVPGGCVRELAVDLGRVADRFGRRKDKSFDRSVAADVQSIVLELLSHSTPSERLSTLRTVVGAGDAVQLSAFLISPGAPWFMDADVAPLRPRLSRGIAAAAERGDLEQFEQYGTLLSYWREWNPGKAVSFVRNLASDPRRFVHFARSIAPYSRAEVGIAQARRTQYGASAAAILEFLPRRTALRAARDAAKALSGQRAEVFLKSLIEALAARPENKPPLNLLDTLKSERAAVGPFAEEEQISN